jgi:hypothetical protein
MQPASAATSTSDTCDPTAETILLTLARVGLYETNSGVVPAWEASPRRASPKRLWGIASALLVTACFGFGVYRHALGAQSERAAEAQELGAHLAGLLDSASRADLLSSESDFQRLFELDSRGSEPAFLWLENRVLHVLLSKQGQAGIESATQRARTAGIEEPRLIFGRLASALAVGDLPGAGQLIAEWDERAKGEALYQLLAGVVFERAGNPEALERFTRASTLQPDLKLAHLLAARLAVLQLGPLDAKPRLELAYARLGPGPATQVLRALEWAASPATGIPAPQLPTPESLEDMAPFVQATAQAAQGVKLQRDGRLEEAAGAFQRALSPAAAPAMAAWIGYQALDAGDLEVARAAAIEALVLSAEHKHSRALAARIALADGRLPAAQDALRGLDPRSRDALIIEAVSAYENLQGGDVTRLLAGLTGDTANPTLRALSDGEKVIVGQARGTPELLEQWARDLQVWGALIAFDAALDQGQLDFAQYLATARAWDSQTAAYATRLVRLKRYQGQSAAAMELAALVDDQQAAPRAVAEVVLACIDGGRAGAAASHLARASHGAGVFAPWLEALVESAQGRQTSAARSLQATALPGKSQPLLIQIVALRALALARDRRARGYHALLERRFPGHPDVQAAARQLGLRP